MNRLDARKLKHQELTELRRRGVTAVQSGEPVEAVARILGVSRAAVFNWLALFRCGGWDRLDAKRRGGRPPKLDAKMLRWVYNTVSMKDPRQMQFPFALWTSRMVAQAVWEKFRVRLSKASVCRLLNQLGLSPQRPLWRAYQQNPELVMRWLEEEYPMIRAMAKRKRADIFFGDEAGIRSDHHAGVTWAPKGVTPVVKTTGARFGVNMISAVSPRGAMRFMLVDGKVNSAVFIEFMKRLLHNARRPVFLIVDGHPSHKGKAVDRFVKSMEGRIRLFHLPPYSPELNPDEQVWNHLKNHGVGRQAISGPEQLRSAVIAGLRKIQKLPGLVQSFFHMQETLYAAA